MCSPMYYVLLYSIVSAVVGRYYKTQKYKIRQRIGEKIEKSLIL